MNITVKLKQRHLGHDIKGDTLQYEWHMPWCYRM